MNHKLYYKLGLRRIGDSYTKREEAIALLRELDAKQVFRPTWVSLESKETDNYELHIKPATIDQNGFTDIIKKYKLALKEGANGTLIIYGESAVLINPEL